MIDLSSAVDREYGIIRQVSEHRRLASDLPVFVYSAHLCDTSVFGPVAATRNNAGASTSRKGAFMASLCESLERYCLGSNNLSLRLISSAQQLGQQACSLSSLPAIPSPYPSGSLSGYHLFDNLLQVDWVPGTNLASGEFAYVPANLVYVPYKSANDIYFDRAISSGAALAESIDEAFQVGILEVIERDAVMLWWLAKLPAAKISSDVIRDAGVQDIVTAAISMGYTIDILDITSDIGIPVVVSLLRSRGLDYGPSLAIGASARLNIKDAVKKAVTEMAHTLMWQNSMIEATDYCSLPLDDMALTSISDHPLLWTSFHRETPLWFQDAHYSSVNKPYSLSAKPVSVRELANILVKKGYNCYGVEITTNDVAALGARVVKVVIPGLHPLEVGGYIHLSSSRLIQALRLGDQPSMSEIVNAINGLPHPFP